MARWTRAIRALPAGDSRALDLGCAFGFATRMLRRRGFEAVGVDASPDYIAQALRADPSGTYLLADAAHVPLPGGSFDAAICLDVLEHLADDRAAVAELARLVRPDGTVVVSVPHRGPLWRLDSLNLYARFVRLTRRGRLPPELAATDVHRHYSVAELRALLEPTFEVLRVERTGLGLAELVHLPVLLLFRWLLPIEPVYRVAAYAYYAVYLMEDVLPLGPAGYHLLVVATRR